jgi:hypothetical protein
MWHVTAGLSTLSRLSFLSVCYIFPDINFRMPEIIFTKIGTCGNCLLAESSAISFSVGVARQGSSRHVFAATDTSNNTRTVGRSVLCTACIISQRVCVSVGIYSRSGGLKAPRAVRE